MFITEKEEDSFYYNFSFDFDGSISITNKKDNYFNEDIKSLKERKKLFNIKCMKEKHNKNKNYIFQRKSENKKGKTAKSLTFKEIKDDGSNILNKKELSPETPLNSLSNIFYRKDAYYKFFKVNLGKFIKNKMNILKNKSFSYYSKNNFSTPSYKYTGNPKEKDNFHFLSFTIKELLIYGKDKLKYNRQYNNEQLINFIEGNEYRAEDKEAYKEMMHFLNNTLEDVIKQFYDEEEIFNNIKSNSKAINFDSYYKRETGISLLEKYGFLEAIKKYNKKTI